ncbi:hypothetical protein ACFVH6_02245 [Spirillospora sp. NPDC127200]
MSTPEPKPRPVLAAAAMPVLLITLALCLMLIDDRGLMAAAVAVHVVVIAGIMLASGRRD